MGLQNPVSDLSGVGDAAQKKFAVLGIKTVLDLIDYLPKRYNDFSEVQSIASLKPGDVTIRARIKQAKGRYVRRGMHVTEAVVSDDTGSVKLVWFNQPYRESSLKKGQDYYISGEFGLHRQQLSITSPAIELTSSLPIHTARIIPIYRETKGFTSVQIRKAVAQALEYLTELEESLPDWMIKEYKLVGRQQAYRTMHFPESAEALEAARKRIGFEEVFHLTLAGLLNKQEITKEIAQSIPFDEKLARDFVSHLPFKLTNAQRKAVWQIYLDMQKTEPMNRLLEGDVGSGKTAVAAMASLMAMHAGFQVAFMAPTELLARQHAETLYKLLQPLGKHNAVGLLVGGMTAAQKKQAHQSITSGKAQLIVGTHALIQDKTVMHDLGLVIIDEQHRFGVEQRKELIKKAGSAPHILSMTATPIPRSLALTLYGELDVSVLNEKPKARKSVETVLCSPNSREQLYEKINLEVDEGRQVFVVCPLISEPSLMPVKSAEETYAELAKGPFKHRKVGLLHGKQKAEDKDKIMTSFAAGELDVLVATTVIEVGVDVPNATVMLIENAERFGLAQLHQLRGRIGRSSHQGYCYLMLSDSKTPSKRLRALASSNDGFKLAELDLELRGPGAIYGTLQHGALDLRIAKLTDRRLIVTAREAAQKFIDKNESLLKYKELHNHVTELRKVTRLN